MRIVVPALGLALRDHEATPGVGLIHPGLRAASDPLFAEAGTGSKLTWSLTLLLERLYSFANDGRHRKTQLTI